MSNPEAFFRSEAAAAAEASARTGVPASVILAQWAVETGYGTSAAFREGHNFAGVSPGGRVARYPSRAAGLAAYISTLLAPRYAAVRSAGEPTAAAVALGESPWAESRYGGRGAQLVDIMASNNLTRFDDPSATTVGWDVPGTSWTVPTPSDVADSAREWVVKGIALAAAAAMIVAGAWRMSQPARQKAVEKMPGPLGMAARAAS